MTDIAALLRKLDSMPQAEAPGVCFLINEDLAVEVDNALQSLLDENAKLREALKPFGEEAPTWRSYHGVSDDVTPMCSAHRGYDEDEKLLAKFTVGDLRRAADLLKEGE